ncbi:MAG: PPC domain-containing protein [Candidatus Thorarchaeota archaeon]
MKRKHTLKFFIIIMSFLVLSLTALGSITAFPGQTDECGSSGCHDTAGTLTLGSNSTTVNATSGTPFTLQIDAGNGAMWVSIKPGWADNSNFTISDSHVEDGSADDANAAPGEITVVVTFTPLSPGNLTIRVWTAAGSDLASSIDIDVEVTGQAITTVTPPPDPSEQLYEIWIMLMIAAPVAAGVLLVIFGYIAIKRK